MVQLSQHRLATILPRGQFAPPGVTAVFHRLPHSLPHALLAAFVAVGSAEAGESPRTSESRTVVSEEDDHWWGGFGDWAQLGLPQPAYALFPYAGGLVVGGGFLNPPGNAVASWDGAGWSALGAGVVRGYPCSGLPDCLAWVAAMTTYRGDLIVAGKFNYAGGATSPFRADNIARWDGTSWHPLSSGFNGYVSAVCIYDDELVASGYFTIAGGRTVSYVARWDGLHWRPMGELNSFAIQMVVFNGELIATGFTQADGQPVLGIARWNGSSWSPFGTQSAHHNSSVFVLRDSLYANVIHQVNGFNYPLISRWNGISWDPLGTDLGAWLGDVNALVEYNGNIIAGGFFRDALQLHNIARWEGSRWVSLGSGVTPGERDLNAAVTDLAVYQGSLYVCGAFTAAGNKPSWFIARWDDVITAVQLESFDAVWEGAAVHLAWQFSPDALQELAAVSVERSEDQAGSFFELAAIPSMPQRQMSYRDSDVEPDRPYFYRLRLVQHDGQQTYSAAISAAAASLGRTSIYPIRDSGSGPIAIRYLIGPSVNPVRLAIYAPTGRLVRSLDQGRLAPGEHLRYWDRRSQDGASAARGVYLVHLATGVAQATQKLVLLNK